MNQTINAQNYSDIKGKASPNRDIRVSKLGYQIVFGDPRWHLNNHTSIKWAIVPNVPGSDKLLDGFRNTLANYSEQVSPNHTKNMFDMMNRLIPFCKDGQVTVKAINEWRDSLGHDRLWYLGNLRGFLLQWADWGFKGIDPKVPDFLDTLTLPGNEKGRAVRINCPRTGPFDRQEYQALGRWVQSAWRNNEISISDCALLRLFMETGRRPSEVAAVRIGDLRVKTLASGANIYSKESYRLLVTRAKRRGKDTWRDLNTADELPISDDLYDLLHNLGNQVIRSIEQLWGVTLRPETSKELPLFISVTKHRFKEISSPEEFHAQESRTPDFFHENQQSLALRLIKIGKACTAVSARINDYMLLSSYRFRRTLGTVLAKNGYNAFEIAAALGHDDIQNVQVYVENSAEAFDRYEETVEPAYEPLLKAFSGEIIRANSPGSEQQPHVHVLVGFDAPFESGKCGSLAQCHRGWYICYTCVKFRAFIDADHELALKEVEAEYESTKTQGYQDSMLTGLEATIDAIKEVLRLCKKLREEAAHV
jgi:integrase